MINVCILPHPRFLKSSVVIDFFSQCYWLKQNWHVLTTPFQVTRGCRWETVTYNFHPTQMAQRRLATGLQLWTTSGSRESGMLCLFWLACIEILLTHVANSAMLVFIQSITRGPQVHHHSCKLRQQWLANTKALYYFFFAALGTTWEVACCTLYMCHSWCLLSPGERSCRLRFIGFAWTANTKTRSKANSTTLPLVISWGLPVCC